MNSVLFSLLAFILAIGVLVTVHEFGHFWVARRLGVKVLRFSIGFGKPLWKKTFGADRSEFVIAALPLGGYVRMLDEREGEVAPEELPRAFNRQPVSTRVAVVVAGPLFNFLFAIAAYWLMFVVGIPGLRPVVGDVTPGSYAAQAGIVAGDEIIAIQGAPTPTWESAVMSLLDASLDERDAIELNVRDPGGVERDLQARLVQSAELLEKGGVLRNFGLAPWQLPAVLDELVAGEAAERGGLRSGDHILAADGKPIAGWNDWVEYVRARPEQSIQVEVQRDGATNVLELVPKRVTEGGKAHGFIGASVRLPDAGQHATMRVVVRHGPLEALPAAVGKTWEVTTLTLRTLWKMLTGKASVENLSGPISIARYAGESAAVGLTTFLAFLGIVSVSLGVLNLLPIPVLDGGHLLYYLVEMVKGSPVSEAAQLAGQKVGIFLLLMLMSVAFYNDLVRLID
ncbi:MAG TPA: RIP metalloprotease RseP [Gammaproteobacteria bacterium]|nr:RIP metalloprotease RseP [Gammaproteobacteria bacterium]